MKVLSGKKFKKRYARRKLRRELQNAEGWTIIGPRFSRMHWGDGIAKGDTHDRVRASV